MNIGYCEGAAGGIEVKMGETWLVNVMKIGFSSVRCSIESLLPAFSTHSHYFTTYEHWTDRINSILRYFCGGERDVEPFAIINEVH